MYSVGVVALSSEHGWTGGAYYLQHLIKCVASLQGLDRIELRDVWWRARPEDDPFKEVRDLLGASVVVEPPVTLLRRAVRLLRRMITRTKGAKDLFDNHGVDVLFPCPPCENQGTPYVFWIPDFQYVRRPDLMSEDMRQAFKKYYSTHAHAAAQIVLSSDDARRDFSLEFPYLLDKVHVVKFCSVPDREWWRLDPEMVAAKRGLPEKFLIVCNQFTRHKNHAVLVKALGVLRSRGRSDIHLVCTGSTFDYRNEDCAGTIERLLEVSRLTGQVHIMGVLPRAEQIALLRRSIAVLQPSSFEGWSTVIEDAKTLGKPVLASNLPVHIEQLGHDHPCFLDPDDEVAWADAIIASWAKHRPGPNRGNEERGLADLEVKKRECGMAFVGAIRSAMRRALSEA